MRSSGEPIGYFNMIRHVVVCVVISSLLQAMSTSSMTTAPPPPPLKFVAAPGTVGVDVNQSAALEWTLDIVPENYHTVAIFFKGIRVFQYTPYNGMITNTSATDHRFAIYNTTTKGVGFRLERLLPDDAGNYTCELTGATNEESRAILLVHAVPTIPTIAETPGDYVEGKTNVTLICAANSTSLPVAYRPAMLYTWSRNGVDIDRTGPPKRHTVLSDSGQTLEISPVHHKDTTYTCTASENGTQLTSVDTQVTLDVLYGPLNISIHPDNPTLAFNETLVLTAYATCHPTCDFEWQRGSDVISLNSTLTLYGSEINSSETYEVTANNDHGNLNLFVAVTYIPGEVPEEPTTTAWTIVTNPNGNSSSADPGAEDDPDDNTVIIIAVSVVLAVVVIATVMIVAVVLVRKRKSKENGTEEFDELTPYVTVSRPTENGTQPGSQPGNQPGNRSGNSPQADEDPLSGQSHPEVIPPVIYAEVIKKTKGAESSSKPTVDGNSKQPPPKVTPPVVYAEVIKKTKGAASSSKPTVNTKGDTKPVGKPPPTTKKPKLRDRPPPIAPRKAKENGAKEFDKLTPCGTVSRPTETGTQLGAQLVNQAENQSVDQPQGDGSSLSGQPHPEVIPPVIYGEVIKKTKGAGSNSKPTVNGKDNAKPPGKPPPTAKKPTLRERPPPIAPPKAVPDMDQSGLGLTNAAFEATGDDMRTWEHTYSNVPAPSTLSEVQLQGDSKDQGQSPEGITYADIAFVANGNGNNDVVRREVEPTEYATLALRHTVPGAEDG